MKKDIHLKTNKYTQEMVHFFEDFLVKEKELFHRNIHGFEYWHFIRFDFYNYLLKAKGWIQKPDQEKKSFYYEWISKGIVLIKNALQKNLRNDNKKTEILVLNSANRVYFGNRYIDPYTYLLLKDIPFSYTIWEQPIRWRHKGFENDVNLFYFDSLHLETFISRFLHRTSERSIREEVIYLIEFAEQFGLSVSERNIQRLISYFYSLYQFGYRRIRDRILLKEIKLIIVVNHYDPVKMLVTYIARSLGVYVVELQHGIMGKYHIPYNFSDPIPLKTLPDEIWTFGTYWNKTKRIKNKGVKLIATGSPYVEYLKLKTGKQTPHKKVRLLFISQWTIARQFEELAIFLSDNLNPDRYEIFYKFHPKEYGSWQTSYSQAFQLSNINFIENEDIYSLMNNSDMIFGVYSTAVIESLIFNKPLILLESYGVHWVMDLIHEQRAVLVRNKQEAVQAILDFKPNHLKRQDITKFWATHSINTMHKRLDEIINLK